MIVHYDPIVSWCENRECNNFYRVKIKSQPGKFCSRSCAIAEGNRTSPKRSSGSKSKELIDCGRSSKTGKIIYKKKCIEKECEKLIVPTATRCLDHHHERKKEDRFLMWESGQWDGASSLGISRALRERLLERANFHCESPTCCVPGGWGEKNPLTGKSALQVDHIDGNAFNNVEENLRVLCPNCHSLTDTYGSLNRGNGRTARKREKQIKSE